MKHDTLLKIFTTILVILGFFIFFLTISNYSTLNKFENSYLVTILGKELTKNPSVEKIFIDYIDDSGEYKEGYFFINRTDDLTCYFTIKKNIWVSKEAVDFHQTATSTGWKD